MGGCSRHVRKKKSTGESGDVDGKGLVAGDAKLSYEVREVQEGSLKGVGGDGGCFEGDGALVRVDLNEADERIIAGDEGTL